MKSVKNSNLPAHSNPNCLDSRFCLPHGEMGPVQYDMNKIFSYVNENRCEKI
jgi:hypothetical protein